MILKDILSFFQVYDFPPTVSKEVSVTHLIKEETYDVPSHLSNKKPQASTLPGQYTYSSLNADHKPNRMPDEDVYDVPPPTLTKKHGGRDKVSQLAEEIYNFPARVHHGGQPPLDVYDFPREQEERGESECTNIYDVPPQVGDAQTWPATFSTAYLFGVAGEQTRAYLG